MVHRIFWFGKHSTYFSKNLKKFNRYLRRRQTMAVVFLFFRKKENNAPTFVTLEENQFRTIFQKICLNLHPSKALGEKEIFEALLYHERKNNTGQCVFEIRQPAIIPYLGGGVFLDCPKIFEFLCFPNAKSRFFSFRARLKNNKTCSYVVGFEKPEKDAPIIPASEDFVNGRYEELFKGKEEGDYLILFRQLMGNEEGKFVRSTEKPRIREHMSFAAQCNCTSEGCT
eukprot:GHVP01001283.1.p1 GENE.GHVP01001283.1~~GHVP01001283.1.p1  ORF type:complete len:227 (+),score=29.20 GHVP01001283.1:182-862(+)